MFKSVKISQSANYWFLVSLILASLFCATPGVSRAQSNLGWSQPQNISTKMPQAWFPDIAVDGSGTAHIIWSGSDLYTDRNSPIWEKYDRLFYTQASPAGSVPDVTPANVAVSPFGVVVRNSVAVDSKRGLVHILYRSKGSLYYQNVPINKAFTPVSWSEPRNIDDFGVSYYSDMAVDSRGVVHIVWSQAVADEKGKLRQVIMYRQSNNEGVTWSFPKMVGAPKLAATRPVLKIDNGGGLHVSWDDGYDNYVPNESVATYGAYLNSLDDGKTWGAPQFFGSPEQPIVQTVMTPFGANGVMMLWRVYNQNRVDYAISNDRGKTFGNSATVSGVAARNFFAQHFFDRFTIAADAKGRVHFAGAARYDGKLNAEKNTEKENEIGIIYSYFENNTWSKPEAIGQLKGFPEYPRIGIAPDRIHVVWFLRDKPINEDTKQIYYSSKVFDTGLTPEPVASFVAPAAATPPAATPVVKPTPKPILAPVSQEPSGEWMRESYFTVGVSMVPIILAGLGLTGFLIWRRRRSKY